MPASGTVLSRAWTRRGRRRLGVGLVVAALASSLLGAPPADAASAGPAPEAEASAVRCPRFAPKAHWIVGRVHTCGQRLIDARGREVRSVGLEETNMGWGSGTRDTDVCGEWEPVQWKTFAEIRDWGLNTVELFVSWANLEPVPPTRVGGRLVHHWNLPYLAALDAAIARFGGKGIPVVLMMHQSRWSAHFRNLSFPDGTPQPCGAGMPAWLYRGRETGARAMVKAQLEFFRNRNHIQKRFAGVWQMLARRYLDDRVIGAGILFEAYDLLVLDYPGTENLEPKDLDLAGFYERVGAALHWVNPELLLLLPDRLSRGSTIRSSMTRRPRVSRAVYAFEYYARNWNPDGREKIEDYHRRAAAWRMPGWITEFSAFGRTKGDEIGEPHWRRKTLALLRYAREHHVGWSLSAGPDDMTPGVLRVIRAGY